MAHLRGNSPRNVSFKPLVLTFKKKPQPGPAEYFLPEEFPKQQLKHIQVGWVLFSLQSGWWSIFFSWKRNDLFMKVGQPPKHPAELPTKTETGADHLGSRFKYMGDTPAGINNLPTESVASHWTWVDRSKSQNQKPTVRERLVSVFFKAFGENWGKPQEEPWTNDEKLGTCFNFGRLFQGFSGFTGT